jgi:hypothetical protein
VKAVCYSVYLAMLAGVVLFNRHACRRGMAAGAVRAVNIVWSLAMALLMLAVSEPLYWFHDFRVAYWDAACLAFTDPAGMYRGSAVSYVNLPAVAVLFVPLTPLGCPAACLVFLTLGVAAVAAGCALTARVAGLRGCRRWALAVLFLANGPLFYSLREGNLSHFVLPVLAAALWGLERGRDCRAGFLLGVAAVIKPPLVLLPVFVGWRRRRLVAGCAIAVLAAVAVSLLLFGIDLHLAWYEHCIRPFSGRPMPAYNVQSLSAAMARLLLTNADMGRGWDPVQVSASFRVVHGILALTLAATVLAACLRPAGDHRGDALRLEFSAALCLALVISPVSWIHYYLLLLLPAGLALGGRLAMPADTGWTAILVVSFLAMSLPVRGWSQGPWWASVAVSHYLAGGLMLLAALCAARWRLPGRTSASRLPPAAVSSGRPVCGLP